MGHGARKADMAGGAWFKKGELLEYRPTSTNMWDIVDLALKIVNYYICFISSQHFLLLDCLLLYLVFHIYVVLSNIHIYQRFGRTWLYHTCKLLRQLNT